MVQVVGASRVQTVLPSFSTTPIQERTKNIRTTIRRAHSSAGTLALWRRFDECNCHEVKGAQVRYNQSECVFDADTGFRLATIGLRL